MFEAFNSFILNLNKDIDAIKQDKQKSSLNRNALKAYCFLINWIIEQFSYEQSAKTKTIKTTKRKKHTKGNQFNYTKQNKKQSRRKSSLTNNNNTSTISNVSQLIINVPFVIKCFDKLIQIHLEYIFNNKIIENELLSSIIITFFHLLKIKPPIHKEKDKIFNILNSIITQYHDFTNIHIILQNLTTSIIELIYNNETLTSNLSEFICLGIKSNNKILSLTNEIIQELIIIINKDSKYESQGMKNIGAFFTTLETKSPNLIYNSMPTLIKLYDSKSYIIRNSISEMIGGVIIDCLSKTVEVIESADTRNEYYKAKQKFIDILFKRLYDENCFCRNKVLQVCERLCDCNALGIEEYLILMKEATIRVKDERAQVRKRAIELLEKVIKIFASLFKCDGHFADVAQVNNEIEKSQLKIDVIKAKIHKETLSNNNKNDIQAQVNFNIIDDEKQIIDKDDQDILFNQLNNEETRIEYYLRYKTIICSINSTLPYIIDLLYSKSISDVIQSISLLKTINQLNISEAFIGIKKMLNLILSSEKTIQKKVKETIINIYFNSSSDNSTTQLNMIMHLMSNLGFSGLNCFGLIIRELIKEHMISLILIKEIYLRIIKTTCQIEDRNCLFLLIKSSESDQRAILDNADVYLKIFEQRLRKDRIDWGWIKEGLNGIILIQHHAKEKDAMIEEIIERIVILMITKSVECNYTDDNIRADIDEWYGAAQEIINALFEIYTNPDQIANNLINILIKNIIEEKEKGTNKMQEDIQEIKNGYIKIGTLIKISKLIFLIGHISLNMICYIETIQAQIKQRNQVSVKEKGKEDKDQEHQQPDKEKEGKKEYNIDLIQRLFDYEYLSSSQFKLHCTLISSICQRLFTCSNLEIEANSLLYKSSLLALCKLMCVNSQFCADNLPFVFEVLISDSIPSEFKLNLYVSLGDLFNRFPNILQQYIPKLFSRLKDNNTIIRRYIITVISHLVLNDMLKLKGEIVDICLLIDTEDQRLKDNILFFFSKISHKGNNIIYNIIPKALTKLDEEYSALDYEKTKSIINLLTKYIEQDKQIENLLEKLFIKLKSSVNNIEWRNTSYCLSLLNYNERHALKFLELYSVIREKIKYDDVIEENFANVINKLKKGKNKEEVEELEKNMLLGKKIVKESKKRKRNQKDKNNNSNKTKSKSKEKGSKAKGKTNKKSKTKYYDGSDDEDEIYISEEEEIDDDYEESQEESDDDNEDIEMNKE